MWLPQGGALKIENLQFTQYSIIMLLSSMHNYLIPRVDKELLWTTSACITKYYYL